MTVADECRQRLRIATGRSVGRPGVWLMLAGCLSLAAAVPVAAQEVRKFGEVDTATVTSVDAEARRLSIESGAEPSTFVVEPVTRMLRGSESIGLSDLSVGDRVVVEARDEPVDGVSRLVADRIVVVVDAPPGQTADE